MSLDFSGLVNVGGNLNIQYLNNPSYVSHNLSFPLLETIGGNFYVYYYYGENLIAPSLTTIGDYLNIYQCYYVTDISLPALQTIGSYFQLYSANELRHANFQSLLTIGSYFYMYASSSLRVLEFPVLDTVGNYFRIYSSGVSTGRTRGVARMLAFLSERGAAVRSQRSNLGEGERGPFGFAFTAQCRTIEPKLRFPCVSSLKTTPRKLSPDFSKNTYICPLHTLSLLSSPIW